MLASLRVLELSQAQHQGIADIKKDKEIETASLYINKILLQKVTQKYWYKSRQLRIEMTTATWVGCEQMVEHKLVGI